MMRMKAKAVQKNMLRKTTMRCPSGGASAGQAGSRGDIGVDVHFGEQ